MRKIVITVSSIVLILMTYIMYKSVVNKTDITEVSHSIRCDYSYTYKEGLDMSLYIASNIKNPRVSYISKNKYYLCSESEELYIPIEIKEHTVSYDSFYIHTFKIDAPNFNHVYVDRLYFVASNVYGEDRYYVGSLAVFENTPGVSVPYKSINKYVDERSILRAIDIEINDDISINKIYISDALNASYSYETRRITIEVNSYNYISSLYVLISSDKGYIRIDNFFVSDVIPYKMTHFYSTLERSGIDD